MRLREYLRHKQITLGEAATQLGVRLGTVERWCLAADHRRFRMPRRSQMLLIFVWSGGQVDPNSFYDLPTLADAAA